MSLPSPSPSLSSPLPSGSSPVGAGADAAAGAGAGAAAGHASRNMSIHATLGAVFIGFTIACCIYGILITQIFSYFRRYPGDKWFYKAIVVIILVLETADQTFIGHLVYYYCISNYANPAELLRGTETWSFILQLTMGAIVGAIVKASFGLRVWRFSGRNIWITGVILLLTFAQLGLAMAFTVEAFKLPSVFAVGDLQVLGTISLAAGVATDLVTAAALCYFLNQLRTGYKTSDSLVNSLVRYAINTGALTSAVSLTVLLLYNVMPHDNLYFVATYFNLSKLYAISYMATLNTRRKVKGRGTDRQGATSNNTNMFHLGTRMPSMGPNEFDNWGNTKASPGGAMNEFPLNTFHPGVGKTRQAYAV